ncbi:MAG: hypothetical protein L6R41_004368, partial [Letrouitia leprolyta]
MADVYLPQQSFAPTGNPIDQDRRHPNMNTTSSFIRPLPNPPFVFPMLPSPDAEDSSKGTTSTTNLTSNGRLKSRSRPQQLSFNALPDFSFHPSPSGSKTPEPHTPSSPSKTLVGPPHPGGHRRNGSEFIGGDGRNATAGLMSTSPTKGEGALPPPPGARTGPPAGRRGHAHRRSGAISSHDVSNILRPSIEPRSGSAPATPSDPLMQSNLPPMLDRSVSQPSASLSSMESPPISHHRHTSSTAGQVRPRVGFSDHVEFIPRPLSTISSETSSSLSTIRPGHSVTGSISSVIGSGNASPPSTKTSRPQATDRFDEGIALSNLSEGHLESQSSEKPPEEHSQQTSEIRNSTIESGDSNHIISWSEVFGNPHNGQGSDQYDPFDDTSNMLRLSMNPDALRSRRRPVSSANSPITRPRTSPEPKVSKRQRKVKSWAGSFLARKTRHSFHDDALNGRGSPAPQTSPDALADLPLDHLNFDEDTTCVIDPAPPAVKPSPIEFDRSSSGAGESSPGLDTDDSEQVLDLDAVYDSSSLSPSFEAVTGSRSPGVRRRLHSSGATGGFDGPGMHYHRRAESAPELAPVNRHLLSTTRLGSSSAMEDVFEEDEENEHDEVVNQVGAKELGTARRDSGAHTRGTGTEDADVETNQRGLLSRDQHDVATAKNEDDYPDVSRCTSVTPTAGLNEPRVIDIVSADEEPRESTTAKSANELPFATALASDPFSNRPMSAPMQHLFPSPSPVFATPEVYSSAVSTPDFSQISFEGPRLHTATSSITDRGTLSSFRAGDHGFDLRASVDDVPSLTSSASTMTNAYPPRVSSSVHTRTSADRPPSLSVPIAPRTRPENASKRSSLASLSRLVGGSHAEKSKLNIEERAQPEDSEKSEKKKGKRISRLMRFWKIKEK